MITSNRVRNLSHGVFKLDSCYLAYIVRLIKLIGFINDSYLPPPLFKFVIFPTSDSPDLKC